MHTDDNPMIAAQQAINNHTTFGELLSAEEKEYLLDHGKVRHAAVGDRLCFRHQLDTRVYILVMGEVEVREENEGRQMVLARLGQGEIFGEISALYKIPRISDVFASRPSVLIELPGDILERVIAARPPLSQAILQRYKHRITETALKNVPLFRQLSLDESTELIERSSILGFPPGSLIVSENEPGDALYIIIHGAVQVSHQIDGELVPFAKLKVGDYFGEWALLTGAPRAATVTALSRIEAIRVDCGLFLDFIQHNPEVRDRIDQVAYNRHQFATGQFGNGDAV